MNTPIGVFDSGLGGLTVALELARELPQESLIYLGDTARCPYGPRSQQEIERFVLEIGHWLEKQKVKLVVIACNTATAAGLKLAQRSFKVPVVGVVQPGARAAIYASQNRKIGVIATKGTVSSGAYPRAIFELDAGAVVYSKAAQEFVELVEEGFGLEDDKSFAALEAQLDFSELPDKRAIIARQLSSFTEKGIDSLVLGCTHFPLLSKEISRVMGPQVRIISSAKETAREVRDILERRGALADSTEKPSTHEIYTTADNLKDFKLRASKIFPYEANYHKLALADLKLKQQYDII